MRFEHYFWLNQVKNIVRCLWHVSVVIIIASAFSNRAFAQTCDNRPMVIAPQYQNLFAGNLADAQSLSSKEKTNLAYQLLLQQPQLPDEIKAYVDYFIAQMYRNYPNQENFRIQLLTDALASRKLSGAELQDAVYNLMLLHQKRGDKRLSERYALQWQLLACQQTFPEVVSDSSNLTVSSSPLASTAEATAVLQDAPVAVANLAVAESSSVIEAAEQLSEDSNITPNTGGNARTNTAASSTADHVLAENPEPELSNAVSSSPQLLQYIEPLYPPDAFAKDITGYVSMSFTITKYGLVSDIEVVAAEPGLIFAEEARRAVSQWIYQPVTVAGKPIDKPNHRVRLEFDIKNDN